MYLDRKYRFFRILEGGKGKYRRKRKDIRYIFVRVIQL